MNLFLLNLLADAKSEANYWPLRLFVWLVWGMIFASIGLGIAKLFWESRRNHAREMERENARLRRENDDLERRLNSSRF